MLPNAVVIEAPALKNCAGYPKQRGRSVRHHGLSRFHTSGDTSSLHEYSGIKSDPSSVRPKGPEPQTLDPPSLPLTLHESLNES